MSGTKSFLQRDGLIPKTLNGSLKFGKWTMSSMLCNLCWAVLLIAGTLAVNPEMSPVTNVQEVGQFASYDAESKCITLTTPDGVEAIYRQVSPEEWTDTVQFNTVAPAMAKQLSKLVEFENFHKGTPPEGVKPKAVTQSSILPIYWR